MILNIFNFAAKKYQDMIQRIQTLYLILADLLLASLLFLPLAELTDKSGTFYHLNASGVFKDGVEGVFVQNNWPILGLISLILATIIFTIFQFRNRSLQIKLGYINILLLIGLMVLIYFFAWNSSNALGGSYALKLQTSFPLVAAVFTYLAIRGIVKDENLVKSIDRIR